MNGNWQRGKLERKIKFENEKIPIADTRILLGS